MALAGQTMRALLAQLATTGLVVWADSCTIFVRCSSLNSSLVHVHFPVSARTIICTNTHTQYNDIIVHVISEIVHASHIESHICTQISNVKNFATGKVYDVKNFATGKVFGSKTLGQFMGQLLGVKNV